MQQNQSPKNTRFTRVAPMSLRVAIRQGGRLLLLGIFVALVSYLMMAGLFQTMLKAELKKNPMVIIEALRTLQAKPQNTTSSETATRGNTAENMSDSLLNNSSPAVKEIYNKIIANKRHGFLGNPQGKKVVVEFFDYNCPYCQQQLGILHQWVKEDNNVKIILVELPILSQVSVDAAFMALLTYWSGGDKGKQNLAGYQRFHEKAFTAPRPLTQASLRALSNEVSPLSKDVSTAEQKRAKEFLQNNIKLANKLKIEGTPSFVYNGVILSGFTDVSALKKLTATKN